MLAVLCVAGGVEGQVPIQVQISVAPMIVAAPKTEVVLPIRILPLEALPKRSFLSLRGFPPGVSLTEGHPIAPGSWAVPFAGLPTLKANIPEGFNGRAEIVISVIAMDGRMLAKAKTALVVEPGATSAAAQPAPEPVPEVTPPSEVPAGPAPLETGTQARQVSTPQPAATPSAEDRARAERALAQGEDYFARGSILVARQYFQRALDAGLAVAALRLGATYDPAELQRLQVSGVVPDRDLARKWYQRAQELGAPGADERLADLDRR
jgi:hypothetical protein